MCTHHLWNRPTGLQCTRQGEHTTHTYEDTHGSSVPDRTTDNEEQS